MKRAIILLIICSFVTLKGNTQTIKITASDEPLNKVIIKLRDSFGAEFSFNDTETANYKVTVHKRFNSVETALDYILLKSPFTYEQKGSVYVICKKTTGKSEASDYPKNEKKLFRLSGRIIQYGKGESLPFSVIYINETAVVSDAHGKFSYVSSRDSIFRLKISQLGYFIKDTLVKAGYNRIFELIPSVLDLEEVIVKDNLIENFNENGEQAGKIKLNHMIAKYMPGSNDNSIFNLLRLQPGITASAEQANDLIIWGAYPGQSQVTFDGFTIFGLKNFNDNISSVNPYMVQQLQILKGGYDASYGDRVGGIVEIIGKNGRVPKPSFNMNLSNFTLNGLIQLPITENSSLLIAGRKTYYQLYKPEDLPLLNRINNTNENAVVINDFTPNYKFYDINVKYSLRSDKGNLFYISTLYGSDEFSYDFNRINNNLVISKNTTESNKQSGASVYYGKTFKNGLNTSFLMAYSELNSNYFDSVRVSIKNFNLSQFKQLNFSNNITKEYKFKINNSIPINEKNSLQTGAEFVENRSAITKDTFGIRSSDYSDKGNHISIFVQDVLNINKTKLIFGGRLSYLPYLNKFYHEPRLLLSSDVTDFVRLNLAWGKYKQFVTKSSVLDDYGNYNYIWTVADNETIPVLQASHFVSGINIHKGGFHLNIEAYYKKTTGLTRYLNRINEEKEAVYEGKSKSVGADVFIKQNFKGHSVWASYSIGETEELFTYQIYKLYHPAPQNQTHELKLAGMFDLDPFYISSDFVYGSGFSIRTGNILYPFFETGPYSRWDASVVFKFSIKRMSGQIGISVLNILNKENIKFSNFERIPADQSSVINIYNDPVPFTPTLFLKIGFK